MEECDIGIARSDAAADQIDAIKRRCASGNAGPVCSRLDFARPLNNDHGYRRFKWLRNFVDFLRNDCD